MHDDGIPRAERALPHAPRPEASPTGRRPEASPHSTVILLFPVTYPKSCQIRDVCADQRAGIENNPRTSATTTPVVGTREPPGRRNWTHRAPSTAVMASRFRTRATRVSKWIHLAPSRPGIRATRVSKWLGYGSRSPWGLWGTKGWVGGKPLGLRRTKGESTCSRA